MIEWWLGLGCVTGWGMWLAAHARLRAVDRMAAVDLAILRGSLATENYLRANSEAKNRLLEADLHTVRERLKLIAEASRDLAAQAEEQS
jgi:hypothetical protein